MPRPDLVCLIPQMLLLHAVDPADACAADTLAEVLCKEEMIAITVLVHSIKVLMQLHIRHKHVPVHTTVEHAVICLIGNVAVDA